MNRDPQELVPGDATATRWRIDVRVSRGADGSVDFHGPFVHGQRGDRFLYLNWGTVAADSSFHLFRRAKLILTAVPPSMVEQALRENAILACTVNLTDAKGNPTCARVRPSDIAWRLITGDTPP